MSPLPGGLTNRNFRVTTTDDGPVRDLVVRWALGDAALLGIDRDDEAANTASAGAAGVGASVVEYRPELSLLVITFLHGRALEDADFGDPGVLRRAAEATARLHAGPPFRGDFDMESRQAAYLATVRAHGYWLPQGYADHADAWATVCAALRATARPAVPCNNDLLAANFIDDGVRTRLIDYEYSGNNDASFELGNTATECGFDPDQVAAYLEAYLAAHRGASPAAPTPADLARVRLQMLASEYGWSLWGFIQAAASPIDFDFRGWGCARYEKAAATFRGPHLRRLLEEVRSG